MSCKSLVLLLLLLSFSLISFAQGKEKFKLPDALNEVSGIIYFSQDSIWWLNDGGNSPTLFLSNSDGEILKRQEISNALNRDWEDLTHDNQGNFYIGDFGNNRNKRRDLTIYIFNLNNSILDSIKFNLPDQKAFPPTSKSEQNFDMEGFFWKDNYLHLFSKSRIENGSFITKHYRISTEKGTQTAELLGDEFLKKRVVTSAAISPDGKTVVLLSYHFKRFLGFFPISKTSIFKFTNFTGDDYFSGEMKKYKVPAWIFPTQYESIDFCDNKRVIIASERTAFLHARGRKFKLR
ncbi:MAG: hypothetical protein ACI85O_002304 [Saprospiraceae bacterium]|jgi:hypothetical protein